MAAAVAVGLFMAFVPVPWQMILAAGAAAPHPLQLARCGRHGLGEQSNHYAAAVLRRPQGRRVGAGIIASRV